MKFNKKYLFILIGIIIAGIYIYSFEHVKFVVPCIFHKLTGLYCPGCGITRCLNALFHLEFYQALRYNLLVVLLLPLGIVYLIIWLYCKLTKKENKLIKKIPNWSWYILLIITILFGILRNIPYFDWLIPTKI